MSKAKQVEENKIKMMFYKYDARFCMILEKYAALHYTIHLHTVYFCKEQCNS